MWLLLYGSILGCGHPFLKTLRIAIGAGGVPWRSARIAAWVS